MTRELVASNLKENDLQYQQNGLESDSGSQSDVEDDVSIFSDSTESPGDETDDDSLSDSERSRNERNLNSVLNDSENIWHEVDGTKLPSYITFIGQERYNEENYVDDKNEITVFDVYKRFLDDDVLKLTVLETNKNYANFVFRTRTSRSYRVSKWIDTNETEMKKFFALLIYMGLVKFPKISDYWSTNILYRNSIAPKVMSRNRFQILLRFIHFADNEVANKDDRLYKIRDLIDLIQEKFYAKYRPGEMVAVDETMIPFRGRLFFRQYIPNKYHKYGIKIFKLCNPLGYTMQLSVYCGRSDDNTGSVGENVVMQLADKYLHEGRTVITDNFYTRRSTCQ